ncbi:histamine H2 receptor-like [Lingula anatina]|uniref:Histamine H2 receptor-like n=1 Tax=Lingula anatina TaxID=7574 RepID=A0A1S3H6A8_LINAN|nr:histamine H2 receptor-like [Lingula anatina]XP_013381535.1 histamine H2 receptor-like [Lingula anatina]XP_013381536.1 histamine H2 receptor-like [Lingula anatina]XP_013381537.1 histamine H2 receptor-like [Lingula anatina]XP_013381538.1 histamine H2 receptor-like [Lingula anatina]|eukprot:XP_013381534.1 histamine H2 receptor-like [Lingula anatina]
MNNASNASLTHVDQKEGTVDGITTLRSIQETVAFGTLLGVIIVITIVGNALVLVSFITERKLRILINYPIISLALTDFLLATVVLPFSAIYTATFNFPLGAIWCNIYISFDVMLCKASIWNITAVSIDRYIAVTWPMEYRQHINKRKVLIGLVTIWFFAAVTAFIPIYLGWNTKDGLIQNMNQYESQSCYLAVENLSYSIVLLLTDFVIPLIVLLFTYVQVLVIARRQAKLIKPHYTNICGEVPTLNTKELKATIMLSAVIATYLVCWILYMVTFAIKPFISHMDTNLDLTALWLGYLNSTANPFVYAVTHSKFRRAFTKLLCPKSLCFCCYNGEESSLDSWGTFAPTNASLPPIINVTNGNTIALKSLKDVEPSGTSV